ncbi:hypothetical protein QNO21_05005 [Microbacterium sp. zg-Y818]|uniref:hypothetical protein n=1 Tax=unclassified Microbacterium TaxID=2609290 RepID=UPI00214AF056|nr:MULTISPECIES: hypothetical protein [unclassified Microbacterium]MCR2800670.1 hypothetical protein [Microbacterium sp. zg.Y818]WIM23394.1 hypothetical protein QNO21_05005 [Microbacterium sp. zg-Y818]
MKAHGAVGAVASVLLVLALTGCVAEPEPAPTPTATGFASEAEAFAAAEETYRAYVDALNQVDLSDPDTFEAVYAWTTGELNASDRTSFSEWHAEGYEIRGTASVAQVVLAEFADGPSAQTVIEACYVISDVDVLNPAGDSVVARDRPPVQSLRVTLSPSESTRTMLALEAIEAAVTLSC